MFDKKNWPQRTLKCIILKKKNILIVSGLSTLAIFAHFIKNKIPNNYNEKNNG